MSWPLARRSTLEALKATERARRRRGGRTVAAKVGWLRLRVARLSQELANERARTRRLQRQVEEVRSVVRAATSWRAHRDVAAAPDTYDVRVVVQRPLEVIAEVAAEMVAREVADAIVAGVRSQKRVLDMNTERIA